MKKLIEELRICLEKFFNIIPGYHSTKTEIFELINEIENYVNKDR